VGAASTQAHQVDIAYNAEYITPLGALLALITNKSELGSGITLTSSAVMRE
jgi:hypothetical protein